jgi:hypothetical protein
MVADTKLKENKEVSERKKLKGEGKITKAGETNKRAEETGNCTKSLDTIGKSAVCESKDPKLDN